MADFDNELELDEEQEVIVVTDEDGNESYYREEMIIPLDDKQFAILVPIELDEEADCDCSGEADCDCCGEGDAFIARIEVGDDGEVVYLDPTDEEYEAVINAYDEIMAEDDE